MARQQQLMTEAPIAKTALSDIGAKPAT